MAEAITVMRKELHSQKKRLSKEDQEFIEGFIKSLDDIKKGRIRRVA